MCGIAGMFKPGSSGGLSPRDVASLPGMRDSLAHRGPDGSGEWCDAPAGIALAHARLAVLDLSSRGAQPMADPGGRGIISYNGEVYNFRQIRRELEGEGVVFLSGTDTEVVLQSCLRWGVRQALSRFNGMFAFALWAARERALYLVRDRMGVKPLYHGRAGDALVFGSTLAALVAHPRFSPVIDPDSFASYLMLRYVPAPATIYRDARKLAPGHYLKVSASGEELVRWYEPPAGDAEAEAGGRGPSPRGIEEASRELEELLADSVRLRLVSDVPLGVFLSGGMDSSVVAALMARAGGARPLAFTVGYAGGEFDESARAGRVARSLGADHRVLTVRPADLPDRLPYLASLFDDPLSDPSALPLALLARSARPAATVALSGDGADELFGGYDRYRFFRGGGGRPFRLPRPLRRALAGALRTVPARWAAGAWRRSGAYLPARHRVGNFAGKWEKTVSLLGQDSFGAAYLASVGAFSPSQASDLLGRDVHPPAAFALLSPGAGRARPLQLLDQVTFLPDDVLTKVDRAGMASSLEIRDPLLDHRIVEWARRLPEDLLFEEGRGKAPLRALARRLVPACGPDLPKMGFALPLAEWFRGPLRPLVAGRLGERAVAEEGLLDPRVVARLAADHQSGRADHSERLWNLLFFSMWRERWKPALPAGGMA